MTVAISSEDEFRRWLEGRDRAVSVALAGRSALRILPVWPTLLRRIDDRARRDILLPIFRGMAVAQVAAVGPTRATEVTAAANAAANAAN
ncbi:MAG: hypothetical protein ACFBRM_01475, partial [Pikeienuella sp.]